MNPEDVFAEFREVLREVGLPMGIRTKEDEVAQEMADWRLGLILQPLTGEELGELRLACLGWKLLGQAWKDLQVFQSAIFHDYERRWRLERIEKGTEEAWLERRDKINWAEENTQQYYRVFPPGLGGIASNKHREEAIARHNAVKLGGTVIGLEAAIWGDEDGKP